MAIHQKLYLFTLFSLIIGAAFGAFCPPSMRNQTACSCDEFVDGAIVKCNGSKGPVVVESLKKLNVELRELVLENANIIEIGPRAFVGMRIKKLVLDNNKIKLIQKNAFRGLEHVLQELSIASNRLTEVPTAALEGLRALNILNLRCNRIGNITDVAFASMPSLIEVHLGCNKICDIADSAFREVKQNMQNIILDNNCLGRMPSAALENMNALIALHIKYNQIERLDVGQLRNMSSLSLLSLTGNQIAHISPNFTQNTPSLRYIYLGENQLAKLEAGAIKQFGAAEIVDLSHNNLAEITTEMFNGMENLQHLNLEANALKEIAPGAFATTPLLLLWLPHNCLGSITPNMFQGAPFLKQVSLAHNNIRNVQAFSFAHLANLHTLDLSYNKIQNIQPSAIMGSDFLTVRVQENPLVCSQDGFHVMNGREAINLTTEANLVCKTDYANDVKDQCPRKPNAPLKRMCCEAPIQSTTTSMAPSSTSADTTTTTASMASSSPSESPETVSTTATTTTTTESRERARARQLNMERFYRLSRRPELMKITKQQRHRSSNHKKLMGGAMGEHISNGTTIKDAAVMKKEEGKSDQTTKKEAENDQKREEAAGSEQKLPEHVAALINGGTVAGERKRPSQKVAKTEKVEREERRGEADNDERNSGGETGSVSADVEQQKQSESAVSSNEPKKQLTTADIHKSAFPSPSFIDSMPSKMTKHPHEHLQPSGEFSKDAQPAKVEVEEKKPAKQEVVVAKQ